MMKNRLIILLAVILLITLDPGNSIMAAQDYNSSRSNKPSPIAEGDSNEDKEELDLQIKLMIGNEIAKINGKESILKVPPFIKNNRAMVPFRFIGEELGAEIIWEADTKKVGYKLNDMIIELWIGKNMALVNGEKMSLDKEDSGIIPIVLNGTTFVPMRFISEALGFNVEWNPETREVIVAAQDYNSSRSNKPSPIKEIDNDNNEDEGEIIVGAQDYNSSRSNKPSPIKEIDNDNKDVEEAELEISWNDIERKAIYELEDTIIEVSVDKGIVLVNGIELKIDEKEATIILNKENEFILGPIHFISNISEYIIEWTPETKELTIRRK